MDEQLLRAQDKRFRQLIVKYPDRVAQISLEFSEPPDSEPLREVEVELSPTGIRRVLGPIDKLVERRLAAIQGIVSDVIQKFPKNIRNVVSVLGEWMRENTIVRIIGAGRALLAASLPANRLAHGGATVSILGDRSPLPNSKWGGGIIAVSASGKTRAVLEIMALAREVNKERRLLNQNEITVIGISKSTAKKFRSLCSPGYFLGIRPDRFVKGVELRALGDIEEYAISELLDALIVAAGLEIGANFRTGHEDLVGGATGPWHQHRKS